MIFRYVLSIAAIALVGTQPSAFAADCGPIGCGSEICAPCAGASGCGACQSTCQSCWSGCQVVGDPACCCWGLDSEGIDVDSLTPQAQSKKLYEAQQARLIFELPEDADVYLSGQRMCTPGEKRTFVVPVLDQKKIFKYEIKVDVVRGGKKYFKKTKIKTLRAGAILTVKVEAPPAPEGEPAQINVAVEPIAAGGPPPDEDKADDDSGDDSTGEAGTDAEAAAT